MKPSPPPGRLIERGAGARAHSIEAQAIHELSEEDFREAVDKAKVRIRERRARWFKWFPWSITIVRRNSR